MDFIKTFVVLNALSCFMFLLVTMAVHSKKPFLKYAITSGPILFWSLTLLLRLLDLSQIIFESYPLFLFF